MSDEYVSRERWQGVHDVLRNSPAKLEGQLTWLRNPATNGPTTGPRNGAIL